MTSALSALSLGLLVGLCLIGIFAHTYRDNWPQFIGMSGVAMWGIARVVDVLAGGTVTEWQCFAHVSMAAYAAGEAWKVFHDPRMPLAANRSKSWM